MQGRCPCGKRSLSFCPPTKASSPVRLRPSQPPPCPLPPLPTFTFAAYKSVRLSVQRLQLDDMLPGTPFPVVLAPSLQQQQAAAGGGAAGQPILAVTWTSVAGGARGRSYLPLILVR